MKNYHKGMKVIAVTTITEGSEYENPNAKIGENGYIYAKPCDIGTVEYVDQDGCPTVRFDKTGSATIVGDYEVTVLNDE